MTTYETYNFDNDPEWNKIKDNLYFSTDNLDEQQAILLKKKQKYYKNYIDSSYVIQDNKTTSNSSTTDNNNNNDTAKQDSTTSNDRNTSSSNSNNANHTSTSKQSTSSTTNNNTTNNTTSTNNSTTTTTNRFSNIRSRFTSNILPHLHTSLHALIVLLALIWFIPLLGSDIGYIAYYSIYKISFLTNIIHVMRKFGTPTKPYTTYLSRIAYDDNLQCLFYNFIFSFVTPPLSVALFPLLIRSIIFLSKYTRRVYYTHRLYIKYEHYINNVLTRENELKQTAASLEIMNGVALILNIFILGTNQFLVTFFYWQLLRIKYNMNSNTKIAFQSIRIQVDGWLNKSFIPSIIRTVWNGLCNFLYKQADMSAPTQRPTSFSDITNTIASKCSIM